MLQNKRSIIVCIVLFALFSAFFALKLKVVFDFKQFFPEGDEDLIFFQQFTKDFEQDDNFLLVSINNKGKDIWDTSFMNKVHNLTLDMRDLPYIKKSSSITTTRYPIKTPFGINLIDLVHRDDPQGLLQDKALLMEDDRFKGSLLAKDGKATAILLKTANDMGIDQSDSLIVAMKSLLDRYGLQKEEYNLLGKPYFQSELVWTQKIEIAVCTIVSAILVSIIMYLIFGTWPAILITVTGIGLSLLAFMGVLGLIGRELSLMAALYPVMILIVGCSDVIHLMSCYVDRLREGDDRIAVMKRVIKEIGLATFLTSITTAIGFITLLTSRLGVLREFGINAAMGVMLTYVIVILIVPFMLLQFDKKDLYNPRGKFSILQNMSMSAYYYGKNHSGKVYLITLLSLIIFGYGLTKITTNYNLLHNLPNNSKVTDDFIYFDKNYAGFRPLELAIEVKSPNKADDFEVVKQIDKIEKRLRATGKINSIFSQATIYKSMEMMNHNNTKEYYKMPDSLEVFEMYKSMAGKVKNADGNILINKDKTKTRITSIINDIGADSIKALSLILDKWILDNTDTNLISVRRTGTGIILDKNSIYVTENLLNGLVISIVIISLLIAILVKNIKMLLISIVVNVIPLLFAGALLGYLDIALEAGVSIIFAVVYGIAVDDTIHFLARFNLCIKEGMNKEQAILETFQDTGKSLILTTVILFFGFLVMLFSNNPITVTVGILIAFTLITALICDIYLLPVLLRKYY